MEPTCDDCGYAWSKCKCDEADPEPIDLAKLREVCPTLAEAGDNRSGYDAVVLSKAEYDVVKARMLELAEENEALREENELRKTSNYEY